MKPVWRPTTGDKMVHWEMRSHDESQTQSDSNSLRQYIKKQRHYFTTKGLSSQGYGFSSSHVWMWELDGEVSWAPKNWCFWPVVLKTLIEGRRRRGSQRLRWLDGITYSMDMGLGGLRELVMDRGGLVCCDSWGHKDSDTTERLDWTDFTVYYCSIQRTVYFFILYKLHCSLKRN